MGRRAEKTQRSHTLPSSPTHSFSSSSSSDFEFTISLSPRKSSATLCPADELFYKGQLLPLHLSPRLSMVRALLLSSSSSSSDTTTTASRDSSGSSTDSHCSFTSDLVLLADGDSSRPSSATEEDDLKRLNNFHHHHQQIKKTRYFSLSRLSSVFRKEPKTRVDPDTVSTAKRMSSTAKEVIFKYLKKVKPLYEKFSQNHQQQKTSAMAAAVSNLTKTDGSMKNRDTRLQNPRKDSNGGLSHSFSGNLRYPRRKSHVSSCPSSMRSSPSHSGVLYRNGFPGINTGKGTMNYVDTSSMEELQSAIQGAIAHCKNSMIQNKSLVSNEI